MNEFRDRQPLLPESWQTREMACSLLSASISLLALWHLWFTKNLVSLWSLCQNLWRKATIQIHRNLCLSGALLATLVYPYAWAPGVRNPDMNEAKLCSPLFRTGTIRPPTSYTSKIKRWEINGHPEVDCSQGCELDHVWPIEAGGDPRDVRNLAIEPAEPRPGFHEKDKVENYWHSQICQGLMKIDDVGPQIPHWQEIYQRLYGSK